MLYVLSTNLINHTSKCVLRRKRSQTWTLLAHSLALSPALSAASVGGALGKQSFAHRDIFPHRAPDQQPEQRFRQPHHPHRALPPLPSHLVRFTLPHRLAQITGHP